MKPGLLVAACWLALNAATAAQAQSVPPRHLVVPFQNSTGESRVYWLAEASAILLTDDLNSLGATAIRREDRLRAFDRLRVPPVAALSHATVIRLGQLVGALEVVTGVYELQGDELVVRARTIRLIPAASPASCRNGGPSGKFSPCSAGWRDGSHRPTPRRPLSS